jgi:hypothetical protein
VRAAPTFAAMSSSFSPFWQRHDRAVRRQPRRQDLERARRVLRLHRQEYQSEPVSERGRGDRAYRHGGRALAALDRKPLGIHGRDVVFCPIDEQDVVARAGQRRAGHAADRAGAEYGDRHRISPERTEKLMTNDAAVRGKLSTGQRDQCGRATGARTPMPMKMTFRRPRRDHGGSRSARAKASAT